MTVPEHYLGNFFTSPTKKNRPVLVHQIKGWHFYALWCLAPNTLLIVEAPTTLAIALWTHLRRPGVPAELTGVRVETPSELAPPPDSVEGRDAARATRHREILEQRDAENRARAERDAAFEAALAEIETADAADHHPIREPAQEQRLPRFGKIV